MIEASREEIEFTVRLCHDVGLALLGVASMTHDEPDTDIQQFDSSYGTESIMAAPLNLTHALTDIFLMNAGDCVYSISQVMSPDATMNIAPGVLARTAAEYSARAWYLSDPDDSATFRVAKTCELIRDGMNQLKLAVTTPLADTAAHELRRSLDLLRTRLSQSGQLRVKVPNFSTMVERLDPGRGQRVYDHLSSIVHANAVAALFLDAKRQNGADQVIEVINQAQFAAHCGLLAGIQTATLRGGDVTELLDLADEFIARPD